MATWAFPPLPADELKRREDENLVMKKNIPEPVSCDMPSF